MEWGLFVISVGGFMGGLSASDTARQRQLAPEINTMFAQVSGHFPCS